MAGPTIEARVRDDMESRGIDAGLSLRILDAYNRGEYDRFKPIEVSEIPEASGESIVDLTDDSGIVVDLRTARDHLGSKLPGKLVDAITRSAEPDGGSLVVSGRALERIGTLLMPLVSYGVLNGGSASSYADVTKNRGFSAELFDLLSSEFQSLAEVSTGRPKGLTPAYLNKDGTHGPSFLLLKMRSVLISVIRSREAQRRTGLGGGLTPDPLVPLFQMSSVHTQDPLADAYTRYPDHPLLSDLVTHTGINPAAVQDAVQPLIAAYTHSSEGRPKRIFSHAYGNDGQTLPLPGGHGQSFAVLSEIYRGLRASGKRYVYLGNVDNLGYLPDPREIACMALTGKQAGFDFARKTPVDVKGGILVRDLSGSLNCADIGPAISSEDVARAQQSGRPILFNAATGLFDLDYLCENLNRITTDLPVRFTDQKKDAGQYSQAEQVTWEVLGMLDDFLVFTVDKWERFLAAKLLLETLMTSGTRLEDPLYPGSDNPAENLRSTAAQLNAGLISRLRETYGMERSGGVWVPIPAERLVASQESA
jgi:UTP--glucose-1-phosphate uridylyltransferase